MVITPHCGCGNPGSIPGGDTNEEKIKNKTNSRYPTIFSGYVGSPIY